VIFLFFAGDGAISTCCKPACVGNPRVRAFRKVVVTLTMKGHHEIDQDARQPA